MPKVSLLPTTQYTWVWLCSRKGLAALPKNKKPNRTLRYQRKLNRFIFHVIKVFMYYPFSLY